MGSIHMHKNTWTKWPLVNGPCLDLSWYYTGVSFRAEHQYIHNASKSTQNMKHAKTYSLVVTETNACPRTHKVTSIIKVHIFHLNVRK
jgi:hypothetical protein